jgi:hypothetical protein
MWQRASNYTLMTGVGVATAVRQGTASWAALVVSAQGWTDHQLLANSAPFA